MSNNIQNRNKLKVTYYIFLSISTFIHLYLISISSSEKSNFSAFNIIFFLLCHVLIISGLIKIWREKRGWSWFGLIVAMFTSSVYLVSWYYAVKNDQDWIFTFNWIIAFNWINIFLIIVYVLYSLGTWFVIGYDFIEYKGRTLSLNLGLFLIVTFSFTFILYFSDKNQATHPSLIKTRPSEKYGFDKYNLYPDTLRFLFASGSSNVICKENESAYRKKIKGTNDESEYDALLDSIVNNNSNNIDSITARIDRIVISHPYDLLKVQLIGGTDYDDVEDSPSSPFRSNYDIASSRCTNTEFFVRTLVYNYFNKDQDSSKVNQFLKLNWEFSHFPRPSNVYDISENNELSIFEKLYLRSTKITMYRFPDDISSYQHKEKFDHDIKYLDYFYFTVYTITTTGYGDIIPNTELAKTICSLANLFEVLFLVVFLNTLLPKTKKRNGELE